MGGLIADDNAVYEVFGETLRVTTFWVELESFLSVRISWPMLMFFSLESKLLSAQEGSSCDL